MTDTPTSTSGDRPSAAVDTEIASYLDHLAVEKGASPHTLAAYRRDLGRYRAFLEDLGVTCLAQVDTNVVEAFRAQLVQGNPESNTPALAASSAARTLSAVRGLHRFATTDGLTRHDVAATVTPPKTGTRLPKALPIASVVAIIEACGDPTVDTDPARIRDRALCELLYATGARASELIGLNIDDLTNINDPHDATVILRGKGGKERLVPVGRMACYAVGAYLVRARPALAVHGGPALFLNTRGGRLSRQSLWTVIERAARRAGIEGHVSPHSFRHSFATHLLEGGADIRVVQELLGHSSVTTTQVYTLVTVETLREVWTESHPRAR